MIKDYPDRFPATNGSPSGSTVSSPISSPAASFLSPPGTPPLPSSPSLPPVPPPRSGPILPPPRHPAAGPQTTYTPYIPRARRAAAASGANPSNTNPLSPSGQQIPIITSSARGGVTARHPVPPVTNGQQHHDHGPSAALLDKVRALDALPRLGVLRTLDLKGNDIRVSTYYVDSVWHRHLRCIFLRPV